VSEAEALKQAPAEPVAGAPEPAVTPPEKQVIVRRHKALSQRDPFRIAQAFANSQLFPDLTVEAAVVKIIAGEELGIGAMAAIKGIDIVKGNLAYRGNLVATLVKQHPAYDYRVKEKTDEKCEIEFGPAPSPGRDDEGEWRPWPDAYGSSEFTVEDAKRAQLLKEDSNWQKYPRAMCFNRALTEGVRAYIPDVTAGSPAYTVDEIEEVVIDAEPIRVDAESTAAPEADLDETRVDHLSKGIEAVKPALEEMGLNFLDGLNVLLGSLGIDGFDPMTPIVESLAMLSPGQADQLDAELQKMADDQPVDAEVVEDGGEN